MGNLPFERTRYNPVRDTTPEEAERNKRRQAEQEAKDKAEPRRDLPSEGEDKIPDESGE